jgi:TPP-dependent pyruvate/acetoin dehydrogenase alpha subunit
MEAKDPILRLARHLLDHGGMDEAQIAEVKREVEREVEQVLGFAKRIAFPDLGDLDNYVFAEYLRSVRHHILPLSWLNRPACPSVGMLGRVRSHL